MAFCGGDPEKEMLEQDPLYVDDIIACCRKYLLVEPEDHTLQADARDHIHIEVFAVQPFSDTLPDIFTDHFVEILFFILLKDRVRTGMKFFQVEQHHRVDVAEHLHQKIHQVKHFMYGIIGMLLTVVATAARMADNF